MEFIMVEFKDVKKFQSAKKSPLANTKEWIGETDLTNKEKLKAFQSAKKSPLANTRRSFPRIRGRNRPTLRGFNRLKNRL